MLRVRPHRFIAGGETLARDDDGRVVFVRGGLPGEDVTVEVVEAKHDWQRGVVVEVHEASPDRVEPPCPRRHEGCGGCDWQHVAISAQMDAKVQIVIDALAPHGEAREPGGDAPVARCPSGRTAPRSASSATPTGAPSYRAERSNEPVSASGCLVAHPALVGAARRPADHAGARGDVAGVGRQRRDDRPLGPRRRRGVGVCPSTWPRGVTRRCSSWSAVTSSRCRRRRSSRAVRPRPSCSSTR